MEGGGGDGGMYTVCLYICLCLSSDKSSNSIQQPGEVHPHQQAPLKRRGGENGGIQDKDYLKKIFFQKMSILSEERGTDLKKIDS